MQILVTGATDGLGRRVAELLAERGDEVLVHGRSRDKVERVVREIGAAAGHVADLASLAEVRRLAEAVDRPDALINNAGVSVPERRVSEDGYELAFAVNYLSHFLLTLELLPARIVNVASIGQRELDFDDLMLERGYDAFRSYAQSKLAQIMFTIELAERHGGVAVDALHPATLMDTKMVRESFGRSTSTVDEGAEAVIYVLDDRAGSGRYFDGMREATAHPQAYDARARARLWQMSEELTEARATF